MIEQKCVFITIQEPNKIQYIYFQHYSNCGLKIYTSQLAQLGMQSQHLES